jgi:hypothetical protein
VAEAVPANPTTSIATLLPSKKSRDVVIVFILFTPLKKLSSFVPKRGPPAAVLTASQAAPLDQQQNCTS